MVALKSKTANEEIEEAQKVISRSLTIKSTALALIPTNRKNETRCYEFNCVSNDNQEVLIYINVQTLEEEDILILQVFHELYLPSCQRDLRFSNTGYPPEVPHTEVPITNL